jgi:hypothetical protein
MDVYTLLIFYILHYITCTTYRSIQRRGSNTTDEEDENDDNDCLTGATFRTATADTTATAAPPTGEEDDDGEDGDERGMGDEWGGGDEYTNSSTLHILRQIYESLSLHLTAAFPIPSGVRRNHLARRFIDDSPARIDEIDEEFMYPFGYYETSGGRKHRYCKHGRIYFQCPIEPKVCSLPQHDVTSKTFQQLVEVGDKEDAVWDNAFVLNLMRSAAKTWKGTKTKISSSCSKPDVIKLHHSCITKCALQWLSGGVCEWCGSSTQLEGDHPDQGLKRYAGTSKYNINMGSITYFSNINYYR